MNELTKIMDRTGSDKGSTSHNYTQYYHQLFEPMRYKNIKLLEIGIGTLDNQYPCNMNAVNRKYQPGASLRGWRDYFPNAQIYGCDIDKNVLFTDDRIETFYVDQTSHDSLWHQICNNNHVYDIIVDDGVHHFPTNFNVLKTIYGKVAPGGYYIIEDLRDYDSNVVNRDGFINFILSQGDMVSYVQLINPTNKYDNNLFVIKKKDNTN